MPRSQPRPSQDKSPAGGPQSLDTGNIEEGALVSQILHWLDDAKAEDIVTLDVRGKTSIGDAMIIASGRSDRHVGAIADQLQKHLKSYGVSNVRVEGQQTCDWVLVDSGAIIIHLFRPEVRAFYNLEKMWSAERPVDNSADTSAH